MKRLIILVAMFATACGNDGSIPRNCVDTPTGEKVVETNVRVHSKTEYDVVIRACTYYERKNVNPRKIQ